MTHPRIVVRGATYAVTRRCVCRKAFLGWWSDEVDDIWFWCLALAAERCGVDIHHAVRVASHYHLTFTIRHDNLGEFLWWLNRSLSCGLNALLRDKGFEPPRELFDSRHTYVERLVDAESQLETIIYERINPVVAGLSRRCDGIPGKTLPPTMWKGAPLRLERPRVYFKKGPVRRALRLTPPPLLFLSFGGDVDSLVHHTQKLERSAERTVRIIRGGRPPRRPHEVRAIDPWSEPRTQRELTDGRHYGFKCSTDRNQYTAGRREVRAWRSTYRDARARWRKGERNTHFPHGTYEMRRLHGAKVSAPDDDALISAPGPTIEEARRMVADGTARREPGLVDRVSDTVSSSLSDWLNGNDTSGGPQDTSPNGSDEAGPNDESRADPRRPHHERPSAREQRPQSNESNESNGSDESDPPSTEVERGDARTSSPKSDPAHERAGPHAGSS